jgi:FixJ family two-component response regulator
MSDGVVYIVDDNPSVCRALCRLLQAAGLEAVAFASGEEFLAHPHHDGAGCLILDMRMPGLSGLELQERLGQIQETLPIIFLTGHGNVPNTVQAMKGGAVDFLQKPVDDEELLAAVQRALALSRQRRAEQAARLEIESRLRTLTPRERQVLELVVKGLLNKQIAGELGAAEKTIKIHRGRVMQKMRASSVADLVHMAERLNLATGSDPRR